MTDGNTKRRILTRDSKNSNVDTKGSFWGIEGLNFSPHFPSCVGGSR